MMAPRFPTKCSRRGFSLLEVMVALAILTTSLVILVETQSSAVVLTREAERVVTATDLCKRKLADVMLLVEQEGFQQRDVFETGEFDDLGQDLLDAEFGDELEDFHWEYSIAEVDLASIGDAASAMNGLDDGGGGGDDGGGGGLLGGLSSLLGGGGGDSAPANNTGSSGTAEMMGALGVGPGQISEMLGPYMREVRVRVYWGDSSKRAEEEGFDVVIVSHVYNQTGVLQLEQGIPQ